MAAGLFCPGGISPDDDAAEFDAPPLTEDVEDALEGLLGDIDKIA